MARVKATAVDLTAWAEQPDQLHGEPARAALAAALEARDAATVVEAARMIRMHALSALEPNLVRSYRALAGSKVAVDPSCLAKEALLAALDATEHLDAQLFADAALYTQLDRAGRDSGARVRARGVLGLARLGHVDVLPIFGARLADPEPSVRMAAATAIGHRGQREGAGLLLLKLGVGDSEPGIVVECLRSLLALAADLAEPELRRLLARDATRELTLQALGSSGQEAALRVLTSELERCSLAQERAPIIEALGLSVRPAARAALLELLADGGETDARAALHALSIHRYDTRLVEQLRAAVEERGSSRLRAELERALQG